MDSDPTYESLWVEMFGVQAGDQVHLRITGPDGHMMLDKEGRVDRAQARRFMFAGERRQDYGWPSGIYSGQVTLTRTLDGQVMEQSINRTVMIQ